MPASRFWRTIDRFSPLAKNLRSVFDERFGDPREASENRFVWDYWHIPDQYTLVRTPAYHYFPENLFQQLQSQLTEWGQRNLGCQDISPPWLSYYVDGCRQELHADIPHGPFAFVYSLTPWRNRRFRGGETMILKPQALDFWNSFGGDQGLEAPQLVDRIPALFNRLTVFDPRFPHGVVPIEGVRDPREARLVVHGWFTEPRPFVEGGLDEDFAVDFLNDSLGDLYDQFDARGGHQGLLSIRVEIDTNGQARAQKLCNTLIDLENPARRPNDVEALATKFLTKIKWPRTKSNAAITIPFVFK